MKRFVENVGWMKNLNLLIILLGLTTILSCDAIKLKSEKSNMLSALKDSQFLSQEIKEEDLKGKILIVNFWASWCAPCQEETPTLLKLVSENQTKMVLLSINGDADLKEAKKFMRLFPNFKGPNVFVIHDIHKNWVDLYSVTGLPETFIFDSNMGLIKKIVGAADFKDLELKSWLESLQKPNSHQAN